MAVRTAYTPVAGEVLTAANLKRLPGGWIGYNEVTADQAGITAMTDLTGLSLAVTVAATRRVRVTVQCWVFSSVNGDSAQVSIREGSTQLNTGTVQVSNVVATSVNFSAVLTPTTGAHTYKASLLRSSGTGSLTMQAGATFPAFIYVEDVGPAS